MRTAKCGCITEAGRHIILDIDYKNLEFYIAWHYSGDENLGKALTIEDFHTRVASNVFQVPYEEVTGFQRFNGKYVSFGIAYGREAWSLSQGELKELCHADPDIAQTFIDDFWVGFPVYYQQFNAWKRQALETGELRTPTGRVRRWRLITSKNRKHIENQAVNFPIQSLASDVCLSALTRLNTILRQSGLGHVLFTVHDSLVLEVPEDRLHEAVQVIVDEMTTPPFETHIKLFVDIEYGPSLGEVQMYGEKLTKGYYGQAPLISVG